MLQLYDKNTTDFSRMGIVLENASNVKIKEVINGEYLLSFSFPATDEKMQYIVPHAIVKAENQLFKIESIDEPGNIATINCTHISFNLAYCRFIPLFQHYGVSPSTVLNAVLTDTPFSVGTVEIDTLTDIVLSKTNPMEVISKLVENVGGKLVRDNFTINLVEKRGKDNGVQFRAGKNLKDIKRKTDTEIITRLYPFGKDDLDISTVNDGVFYIDSPHISDYPHPIEGYMDFKDIEDPTELKERALVEFSTEDRDGIDKPRITYTINVVELKKLAEYGEEFSVGDTVRIIDDTLGINTVQRIMEYEYYPYEPNQSRVVLSNTSAALYKKNTLTGVYAEIGRAKDTVKKITHSDKIVAQYVDNIREKLQTEINSIIHKALLHNVPDVYVDNIDNPQKALLIGAGVFAIANSRKENGDWDWRTIGTGDKFVADEVNANWVYTGNLNADQIVTGTLSANRIRGGTLSGVTIFINTDAVIGNKLYLGSSTANVHKAIVFQDSESGNANISYNKGGDLNINAYGRILAYSVGGLVTNALRTTTLEVVSPQATLNGKQIATVNDINSVMTDHLMTYHAV